MKTSFNKELHRVLTSKLDDNQSYMSSEQYLTFIEEVKAAKIATKRTTLQYRRLKRFDVCNIGDTEKLISVLSTSSSKNLKYYVKNEELFDILHEINIYWTRWEKQNGCRSKKKRYENITQEAIILYLHLCKPCQMKQKSLRKGLVVKPILCDEMNSRCQVDLIDMQTSPDGNFKFILVYQDHLTKFIQLRPLQSKIAEEVSKILLDIFCIFGSPSILQSDNGREFANQIVESLTQMWPGLKIVHGKPCHSQSQGSVERANQDVQSMLMTWMKDENCEKWSEGLRFVQLMKNRAYHHGIKRPPYQAMFGCDVKVGLRSSALPTETIENIENEEDLEQILKMLEGDGNNAESETITDVNQEETVGEAAKNRTDCDCIKRQIIDTNRKGAKDSLTVQANKMTALSNIKFSPCKIGDTVRVKIPDVDRGRGDFPNVLMVVLECNYDALYKLRNQFGTITELFSRNQFTICEAKFLDVDIVSPEKKSLRQIANAISTTGG
ncbi:unnamed protein product [Parnassius apollo]|uniref:(apollo) hypothetical protein n=1 Tax=Parnassius apollo TaxID=110799 RepID=A0A8S3XHY2_PARAO|nr:unnamed protein product [Parnassius apollo]